MPALRYFHIWDCVDFATLVKGEALMLFGPTNVGLASLSNLVVVGDLRSPGTRDYIQGARWWATPRGVSPPHPTLLEQTLVTFKAGDKPVEVVLADYIVRKRKLHLEHFPDIMDVRIQLLYTGTQPEHVSGRLYIDVEGHTLREGT